jgi:serine protease AprX
MTATTRLPIRRGAIALVVAAILAAAFPVADAATSFVSIIATSDSDEGAAAAVTSVGGRIDYQVPIARSVVAHVPANRLDHLRRLVHVHRDVAMRVQSSSFDAGSLATAFPSVIGAPTAWNSVTGRGIGVALVDTGVAETEDLAGSVVASADLTPEQNFVDTYGHGTFMAGLIAGDGTSSNGRYVGIAPGAHLLSVKVAGADGGTNLGKVLYALQLVAHSRVRFNTRVMLLALSSTETIAPEEDPLTVALEALWAYGVFVVVPAGNSGPGPRTITSPGIDPVLMTVGAVDDHGTATTSDDTVPDWTAQGPTAFGAAKPDVAAPGRSLISLRAPGSTVDREHASARVSDAYFKGTGTSMSAAVTAGAAALVLEANRGVTPNAMKSLLTSQARPIAGETSRVGAGVLNVASSLTSLRANDEGQSNDNDDHNRWKPALPPVNPGIEGTFDWFGNRSIGWRWLAREWDAREWAARAWDARSWDAREWAARAWDNASWNARQWDARQWDGRTWDARQWDGRSWDGRTWDGRTWDGRTWDGRTWDGRSWDGRSWDGRTWDGRTWDGRSWDGRSWDGRSWDGRAWDNASWS